MLDADWHVNVDLAEGVMAMDPYDLMDTLYVESGLEDPTNKSTLYHFVAHFFEQVASAICSLRGRFVVEIIHGEISSIMEKIRYDALDQELVYPTRYNTVHMSNIPLVFPSFSGVA